MSELQLIWLQPPMKRGVECVLEIRGEVDLLTVGSLAEALAGAVRRRPSRVVVDLTNLGFADAASLRCLLRARLDAEAAGSHLILRSPPPMFLRLLDAAGLAGAFAVDGASDVRDRGG